MATITKYVQTLEITLLDGSKVTIADTNDKIIVNGILESFRTGTDICYKEDGKSVIIPISAILMMKVTNRTSHTETVVDETCN